VRKPALLLVAPGFRRKQWGPIVRLPLALLSLAAWLRDRELPGDEIGIWDMRLDETPPFELDRVIVVGISAMTGAQVHYGLLAARHLRQACPRAVIVWGGIHPSLLPEQTLAHPLVDLVVQGEGEETFREVVHHILAGQSTAHIPGTLAKTAAGQVVTGGERSFIDLNDLPLPAYDLLDLSRYACIEQQFDYQTSRGCPFRCAFCYNTVFCGRKWRAKRPDKVTEELSVLQSRYGVRNVALVDDEFFIDLKRVESILDGNRQRGLALQFSASCRLDVALKMSPPLLGKLKTGGFQQLFFGAESGSDCILDHVHKGISRDTILKGALHVAQEGIRPCLSFMSGFPSETPEQFHETLSLVDQLWTAHPLITVNGIFPYSPYPGTETYREAVAKGLQAPGRLEDWGGWSFQYTPDTPWLTPAKRRDMQIAFYIVRFRYYQAMFEERHRGTWVAAVVRTLLWPLHLSARIRWRRKSFRLAWEWRLFAAVARHTFGYL
jgi:radical SAM superfamily enzyme YgiQ (UPF0313 family)